MKPHLALQSLLLTAVLSAGSAQASFSSSLAAGESALAATNFTVATTSFAAACALKPNDAEANTLCAFSRLGGIPAQAGAATFLNSIGVSPSGRNIFDWTAKLPKKGPTGNVTALTTALHGTAIPTLAAAEANLAQITDSSALINLTSAETHLSDVTLDWGDIQMSRAILSGWRAFLYEVGSLNLNASISDITTIINHGGTLESILQKYPKAFTFATPADLAASRAAFTNAIACYINASDFIRARSPGVRRLFNLGANEMAEESQFRTVLLNLRAALNGPVLLTTDSRYTINLQPFFDGSHSPRTYLPAFDGDEFIWGSADATLGGVIQGLTQDNIGLAIAKKFKIRAELQTPGVTITPVHSFPDADALSLLATRDGSVYVVQPGGLNGTGDIEKISLGGKLTPVHAFGPFYPDTPNDGAYPNPLIQDPGPDGRLYGTTVSGGEFGAGALFEIVGGSTFQSVYSFSDGYPLGAPTIGTDGLFYGILEFGSLGAGAIFQVSRITQSMQVLHSFNGVDGANPNGGLVETAPGVFYGTTQTGGAYGYGTVYRITSAGAFQTVYSFTGGSDGGGPTGLALGSDGFLYGATQGQFYDNYNYNFLVVGQGTLFKVTTAGNLTTLYSFSDNQNGSLPAFAPALAAPSTLYEVTSSGGPNKNGALIRLGADGKVMPLAWPNQYDGNYLLNAPLTAAPDGSVYFTDQRKSDHGLTIYHVTFAAPRIVTQPPAKISALAGATVSIGVNVGGVTYQWTKNGQPLADGPTLSGSANKTLTLGPLTANDAGSYALVISGLNGSITSAVSVLTIKPDTIKPTVTFSTATTAGMAGLATDNAGVMAVNFSISNYSGLATLVVADVGGRGGPPLPPLPATQRLTVRNSALSAAATGLAALGAGSTSRTWTISPGVLAPGTNVVTVLATDYSGNISASVTRAIFVPVTAPIDITQTGSPAGGALLGPTNHQLLNIGQAYTITAKPDSNSWFVNWTGTFQPAGPSTNTTLRFFMENGATITANFTSNLFRGMAGTYNGLFRENPIRAESSGQLSSFKVSDSGVFSGKLIFQGNSYPIAGSFPASGAEVNNVVGKFGASKLIVNHLQLGYNESPRRLAATVSMPGASWTAALDAFLATATAPNFPSEFTALLLPSPDQTPSGNGYLLITNHAGLFTITGQLADGTSVNQTTPLSEGFFLPLYASLYNKTGVFIGWLDSDGGVLLTNAQPMAWIKKPAKSGAYAAGFTNSPALQGSAWKNEAPALFAPNPLNLQIAGGQNFTLQAGPSGVLTNLSGGSFTGSMALKSGLVTFKFGPHATNSFGVFLQSQQIGGGFFLAPAGGGAWTMP
ncbi:MAG TPA: choice-of-anchor tandem repeat GloVer-containing protein [Verrucomicrobiae bacterium]|nr:choice-of-anchor tandem repeat GloVer-containing protein [Verrucomicrobiae bacterium]